MDRLMADWSQKPADIDKGVLGRVPLNPVFISLWFCMNAHLSIFFVQPLGSDYSGGWCEARCKSQACEIPQSSFIYFRQVHLIPYFKICFPKKPEQLGSHNVLIRFPVFPKIWPKLFLTYLLMWLCKRTSNLRSPDNHCWERFDPCSVLERF